MYREFYENCRLCPRYCGVNRVRDVGAERAQFIGSIGLYRFPLLLCRTKYAKQSPFRPEEFGLA